jgi:DNA-binding transcriptional ArsR family regulator
MSPLKGATHKDAGLKASFVPQGKPALHLNLKARISPAEGNTQAVVFPAKISLDKNSGTAILNHMVNYSGVVLDSTFAALSDATRRGILARLARGETSVSELAAPYEMSLPAVSKHLRVLEGAGLVKRHKNGRVHRCRLVAEPMKDAAAWIEYYRQFWESQFDSLARYLEESQKEEDLPWQAPSTPRKQNSKSEECSRPRVRKSSKPGRNGKS